MNQAQNPIIVWLRQDLRLTDNPALYHAAHTGAPLLIIYILDDDSAVPWQAGAASRCWLHHSLAALSDSLQGQLLFARGKADDILPRLARETKAQAIYWNRCYEPWRIQRDKAIKQRMQEDDVAVKSHNASLLWEPWQAVKPDGSPYKVFTPFYRKGCLERCGEPEAPLPAPAHIMFHRHGALQSAQNKIDSLALLPRIKWDVKIMAGWTPGEKGARDALDLFVRDGLRGYKQDRNRPDLPHVSRLSPFLHRGDISPRTVWHEIRRATVAAKLENDGDHFCSELGWREFSYNLLYHFPSLPSLPLQEKFSAFPWQDDPAMLEQWQKGMTGYPIVDAGMRELWETGYMHNRVRMIVASFLVKDLLIDWQHGARWFWDCLVDADLANNSASWQWVAGCGADAAPYFRIFNPVTQGQKFDPCGTYIRRWVPELAALPDKYIHAPWETTHNSVYPDPIIDHKKARDKALSLFSGLKKS